MILRITTSRHVARRYRRRPNAVSKSAIGPSPGRASEDEKNAPTFRLSSSGEGAHTRARDGAPPCARDSNRAARHRGSVGPSASRARRRIRPRRATPLSTDCPRRIGPTRQEIARVSARVETARRRRMPQSKRTSTGQSQSRATTRPRAPPRVPSPPLSSPRPPARGARPRPKTATVRLPSTSHTARPAIGMSRGVMRVRETRTNTRETARVPIRTRRGSRL